MKRIISITLTLILMMMSVSVAMAEDIQMNATLEFTTDPMTLNLSEPGEFTVFYSIDNKSLSTRINADVNYSLKDDEGNVLWSEDTVITVSAGGTKRFQCTGVVSKYGVHTFSVYIKNKNTGEILTGETAVSLSKPVLNLNSSTGVSAHFAWNSNPNSTIPYLRKMGTEFVRDEIYWKDYEKEKGVYKMPEKADDYVNKLVENGLEPLIILDFGNILYTETENSYPETDEQILAYGNYVYNLVKDLKGRVTYFEVWNEMNLQGVEKGKIYAKMLKTAYERAKQANPDCKIVGPVTAGISESFFRYMKQEVPDIANYMDVLSYHEYGYTKTPEDADYEGTLRYCTDTLRTYFGADKEIWLTEMGWAEHYEELTERQTAMYTVRQFLNNTVEDLADKMFVYCWINHQYHASVYEANLGLLNGDLSAKRGYVALAAMNHFVGNLTLDKRVIDAEDNYIYTYKNGESEEITVLYNVNDDAKTVTVLPAFENSALYDMYGNKIADLSGSNEYTVGVNGAPKYIVSRKSSVVMNYKTNTAEIFGQIKTANAGEQIMIYVTNPGVERESVLTEENLVYVEQGTVGNNGIYEFSFPMNKEAGIYNIYVGYRGNDTLTGPVELMVKRDISGVTGIYNGEKKIESISDILENESVVVAKGIVDNKFNVNFEGVLYAVGMKENRVSWVESLGSEISGYGEHTIKIGLDKKLVADSDEIKLYLWTDNQIPVAEHITVIK